MKPSVQIDAADRMKLESAIRSVREESGGEIVVAITANSGRTPQLPWILGLVFAALTLITVPLLIEAPFPGELFALEIAAFALGFLFGKSSALQDNLQDSETVCAKVDARARRIFSEAGLQRATGKRGVLLFASLLEKRVVVLADEGAHPAESAENPWQAISDTICEGFRNDTAVHALLSAIKSCGEEFAQSTSDEPFSTDQSASVILIDCPSAD